MKFRPIFAALAIPIIAVVFSTGCSQSVLATTAQAIFVSVDAVLAIEAPGFDETELNAASSALVTSLEGWQTGTDATAQIADVNAVVAVLKTIPQLSPEAQALIAVAATGYEQIITDLQKNQTVTTTPKATLQATPKAYVKTFNAAVPPKLGRAKF